ncbi:MAG: hypothetical protein VKJ86_04290 [Synechococcus sp.]|nr:hypothetical protein [Synechococcus sp.]
MGDRQWQQLGSDNQLTPLAMKLVHLTILGRWVFVGCLWSTCGIYSVWALREEFPLWQDYLTWAVVRLSLGYHMWASLAFTLCVAYTCAVLVWHSHKLVRGWPAKERYRFNQWAEKLTQNRQHWLWIILKRL